MVLVKRTSLKAIALSFLICNILGNAQDDSAPLFSLCSNNSYDDNDTYGSSVQFVLSDVASNTANSLIADSYYSYYSTFLRPKVAAYGHGLCYEGTTYGNCDTCIGTAVKMLAHACSMRMGGQLGLNECRIRYENYPFTVIYNPRS